jgi:hypothetical protein
MFSAWPVSAFAFSKPVRRGFAAAGFMVRLSPEEGKPPLHAFHHLVRPSQPLRSLGRVFWISLGSGEKKW